MLIWRWKFAKQGEGRIFLKICTMLGEEVGRTSREYYNFSVLEMKQKKKKKWAFSTSPLSLSCSTTIIMGKTRGVFADQ